MSCLLTRLSLSRGLEHVHTPPPRGYGSLRARYPRPRMNEETLAVDARPPIELAAENPPLLARLNIASDHTIVCLLLPTSHRP